MIVHPIGTTGDYVIGLSGRLAPGNSITSVISTEVSPSGNLTIDSSLVSPSGDSVILSGVTGGEFGGYYTVVIVAGTALGSNVATAVVFAVTGTEVMARAVTVLEMIRRARVRTNTENKNAVITLSPGDTYGWESDDTSSLISNESLIEYLNDARDEYAKRVPIIDKSSALTEIQVKSGVNRYPYDPRVLAIYGVWYGENSIPLEKRTEQEMDSYYPKWRTSTIPYASDQSCDPIGIESFYTENAEQKFITLGFVPTKDETIRLQIERLPFEKCSWANRWDIILEPDQQYLEALLSWIEYKVYSTHDTEMFDATRGIAGYKAFEDVIGPPLSAKQLTAKRAMTNSTIKFNTDYVWGLGYRDRLRRPY